MEYGIQMYSLRDATEKDLKSALAAVAQMGYKHVEFAGFFGNSAEDVRSWLDEFGLRASGTHTGAAALTEENLADTIAYHKTIGCARIIIPGHDLSTADKIDEFVELVNKVKPVLAAEGISLGYHNHSHEFVPNADGQIIHTELENRTDLFFQIDTFWAWNAGLDPVATLERLAHRVPVIHIKDGFAAAEPAGHADGKPLGEGAAPIAAVRAKAIELGMELVVESETLTPDGPTEAKVCIDWLKSVE